jgi:hypothetical protein
VPGAPAAEPFREAERNTLARAGSLHTTCLRKKLRRGGTWSSRAAAAGTGRAAAAGRLSWEFASSTSVGPVAAPRGVRRASPLEVARPISTSTVARSVESLEDTRLEGTSRPPRRAPPRWRSDRRRTAPRRPPRQPWRRLGRRGRVPSARRRARAGRCAALGRRTVLVDQAMDLVERAGAEPQQVVGNRRRRRPASRTGGTGTGSSCRDRATPHRRRSCRTWCRRSSAAAAT